jgi:hypothetical protein
MLEELWLSVRGKAPVAPLPKHIQIILPDEDEPESIVRREGVPEGGAEPISGYCCIITYGDARGRLSQRRVTCQRLSSAGGVLYIYAYCHERGALRQFRVDRIESIADLHGEVLEDDPQVFFSEFNIDSAQTPKLGWGLPVNQRADLIAGLNALVFMARCDKEWHPAEREMIEAFVTSYWLRSEITGEPPIDDIMAHTDRLSPDPEVFFVSLARCQDRRILAATIRRNIQNVIVADGVIRDEEHFWGTRVDEYFRTLG